MPPQIHVDTVRYKIFLAGKSGVGKTALAARLGGSDIPNMHYETTGETKCFAICTRRQMGFMPIGSFLKL